MNLPLHAFYCTLLVFASVYFFWTGHGVAMEQQKSHTQELQQQHQNEGETIGMRFLDDEEALPTPAPTPLPTVTPSFDPTTFPIMAPTDVCESNINTFETHVDVDFVGDPNAISQTEMKKLEDAFLSNFNNLAVTYCDPLFRFVVGVQSIGVVNASTFTRVRSLATVTTRFLWRYRVSARCKGCSSGTKLFNDALGPRRTQTATSVGNDSGNQQCLCPVDFIDNRSPTTDEFRQVYNESVITLDLPNIDAVVNVVEPRSPSPPMTQPSAMPSFAPTRTPTRIPTRTPTRIPTRTPTRIPTRTPTRIPTRTPTRIPTRIPTRTPTRSPTRTPTRIPTMSPTTEDIND